MFAGHFAPAYVLKRLFPEIPLWALFSAALAPDVLFFSLASVGVERYSINASYPPAMRLVAEHIVFSHSLFSTLLIGALCVIIGLLSARLRFGVGIGAALASHWVLDFIVHAPQLPLGLTDTPAVGIGFGVMATFTLVMELAGLVCAFAWLREALPTKTGQNWLSAGIVLLFVVHVANAKFLPPPTTHFRVAAGALAVIAVSIALAAAFDRARAGEADEPTA